MSAGRDQPISASDAAASVRGAASATASLALTGAKAGAKASRQAAGKAYELMTNEEERARHSDKLEAAKERGVIHAKGAARAVALPAAERVLTTSGVKLKMLLTDDADMPRVAVSTIESMVDSIWPDVQQHVLVELERALATRPPAPPPPPLDTASACCLSARRLRGTVLHAYKPFDASVFGQLRRPLSVACLVCSMCPWFGVRAAFFTLILLLIVSGGTPYDEHQLVAFILHFKATQSFSGVLFFAQAAVQYYACLQLLTSPDGGHACAEHGPGAHRWFIADMLGLLAYVSLAWLAWLLLGLAKPIDLVLASSSMSADDRANARERRLKHGRRLRFMLRYDTLVFIALALLCMLLEVLTEDWDELASTGEAFVSSWRFKATFFLCRAIYALSSFPFLPLALPVLREILSQSGTPTGYDRNGAVRTLAIPPRHAVPRAAGTAHHQAGGSAAAGSTSTTATPTPSLLPSSDHHYQPQHQAAVAGSCDGYCQGSAAPSARV